MSKPVFRRHVFYVPGFDPRGASLYHRIYREEADKQARVNGMSIEVGRRLRLSPTSQGWTVRARDGEREVETCYEFMSWDDIARAHWPKGYGALLLASLRVFWAYFSRGTVLKVARTAWPPLVTGLYPLVFMLLALMLALGSGYGLGLLLAEAQGTIPALGGGVLAFVATLGGARRLGDRLNVFWLLRIYAFTAIWGRQGVPELEARLDAFADRIRAVLERDERNEVLVIGHSVGTILAMPLLARVLDRDLHDRRLSLLTLGECIPLMSFLPQARAYREALEKVARASTGLFWADFTVPVDGACFPLVNPVTASGIELPPGEGPRILSARFHKLFHPEHYRAIRRDWYRMHFQYIMATDLPGVFDYFAMTAGGKTLNERVSPPAAGLQAPCDSAIEERT